ncbi:maleylpyruvate isomerase family mycothiol-dependent enzyme [Streptomyces zagrosensis]|uniref:Uncharacterized protein (TIGR03083 family) n=1 Tax=Streptomyces zagrosensis TaxID=1042984 RepID=A0A7W9QDQ6_9ACTN|nr:maleylpyruvate isomerase family mycothiol-dependent enzyme [Streptomyces zagrosensis]MBB5938330.1 uncharacterized protein (TIGR03083 family) [Streptomyces zagrosensis]
MTLLEYGHYCDEVTRQSRELVALTDGADLSATVPSCPDWTLEQLIRHVGSSHRMVDTVVRTRAAGPVTDDFSGITDGPQTGGASALVGWLLDSAEQLAETLREAGPDVEVWTPIPGGTSGLWARRTVHETLVHRADAALATGRPFTCDPQVAVDTIDEWLEILTSPVMAARNAQLADHGRPGTSIHLHATDTAPELAAEWLIELADNGFTWRRAHAKATVAVRAPLADVLQVLLRRLPADSERAELIGDAKLLDFWLEHTAFG